jgi:nicotinamide-nucleotide adenylyltransferase
MRVDERFNMMQGRFQPFHLGHLNYLRVIIQRPEPFIVGITNPDPTFIRQETESEHRHLPGSNPFSYFQRYLMVREVLRDEQVPVDRYAIMPFPINVPEAWKHYLPVNIVQYVPVFSDWERLKAKRLGEHGFEVVEIADWEKSISATDIRKLIQDHDDSWEKLVPPGVVRVIRALSNPAG